MFSHAIVKTPCTAMGERFPGDSADALYTSATRFLRDAFAYPAG